MSKYTLQYEKDPKTGIRCNKCLVRNLNDFNDHVIRRFSRPGSRRFPRLPVLFRGQRQGQYPILPKIARNDLYSYKFQGEYPQNQGPKYERYMLDQFKRLSLPLLDMRHTPTNDFEWLALARHYGMATRLLDWTENALAALWFAVSEISDNKDDAVVWVFRPVDQDIISDKEFQSNPLSLLTTYAYQPPHFASRIRAQAGWFTVHHASKGETPFQPFEQDSVSKNKLWRVGIAADWLPAIREELQECGVTAALIYPDLTGLCEHLNTVLARP